jgi:iron-sulfur cluster assembly protein
MTRVPAVTLTESAATRVRAMLDGRDKPSVGIRLGIRSQGCSGFGYALEFADEIYPFDHVVEEGGIKVVLDPEAIMAVFGTEIDWVEDKLQKGFVFRNPNEKSRCGCGQSFST